MPQQTPLYPLHLQAGGKMVDFAGWLMPLHYGSQLSEHIAVRSAAGVFDVSHMTIIDLSGESARDYLRRLLANNAGNLTPGSALYSCMLNDNGGVIDDLIVYAVDNNRFRLVVNAATRAKDMAWMNAQAEGFGVQLAERAELAMLAIQGPYAIEKALPLLPVTDTAAVQVLSRFTFTQSGSWFIARTGYTGEDGLEIMLPADAACELWESLMSAGISPVGLGARDTLRLEAGMSLYGQDMDETVTPLESGLGWTVAWLPEERNFIGRQALQAQREGGVACKMTGLRLLGKGVLRAGQKVLSEAGVGRITSGTFSPTLKQSIALARVPRDTDSPCEIEIRDKKIAAELVKYPFVRNGQSLID